MAKHRMTYQRMDKDVHPSKITPEVYYEGRDIRVITTESNDSGSVTPEKGNEFFFQIPEIILNQPSENRFAYSYSGTTVNVSYTPGVHNSVANSLNIVPIGHVIVEDDIIIISCDEATKNGQIWKVSETYDTVELLYNANLNLSVNFPIRSIVARIENSATHKIYWTDFNNILRQCNIKDPDLIDYVPTTFDVVPSVVLRKPQFSTKLDGGDFEPGLVQYAYSGYNFSGSSSALSPLSDMVTLKNALDDSNVPISIQMSINLSGNNFESIRVYRLHYTSEGQEPTVTLIKDESFAGTNYTFIDDGIISISVPSLEEIVFSGTATPFVCKDLQVNSNRLIAANISTNNFNVEYDTRAYRFDSTGQARIDGDTTILLNTPNDSVPTEHDCINPSNTAESDLDYRNNAGNTVALYNQYIYQSDGTTVGGEGPNISYRIFPNIMDTFSPTDSAALNVEGSTFVKPGFNKFKSYKRDEVYRFAIRFINNKGQKTFAKWIGDIRMPNQDLIPMSDYLFGKILLTGLAVEFTVNTSSLPSEVVGYEILRVERSKQDRTIVAQGIVNSIIKSPDTEPWAGSPNYAGAFQPSYAFRTWHDGSGFLPTNMGITFNDGESIVGGTKEMDSNGQGLVDQYRLNTKILQIHSPEIAYDSISFNSNWKLSILGGSELVVGTMGTYSSTDLENSIDEVSSTTPSQRISFASNQFCTSSALKFGNFETNNIATIPIDGGTITEVGVNSNLVTFDATSGQKEFRDSVFMNSDNSNNYKFRQVKDKSLLVSIEDSSGLGFESVLSNNGNVLVTQDSTPKVILADIKTTVVNQYGGNTYTNRSRNEYIVVENTDVSNSTIVVYNGDTFLNYANLLTAVPYSPSEVAGNRVSMLVPMETNQNLDAKDNLNSNLYKELVKVTPALDEETYVYNKVYSRENDLIISTEKPINFLDLKKYTNRIIASETKINGEGVDSWTDFKVNNFMDLEGQYGDINAIEEFNDTIFTFQNRGVAKLLLQPNVQLSGAEGVAVQLGQGTFLYDYDYISTSSGTENQFSVLKSINGIYYYDTINNKIKRLARGDEYLSDVKGLNSWLEQNIIRSEIKEDNPFTTKGISTFYDKKRMEASFTFKTSSFSDTIKFNELLNGFTSFCSYTPSMYIQRNDSIFTLREGTGEFWVHGTSPYSNYYGTAYTPYITLISNPSPLVAKTFDSYSFDSIYDSPDDLDTILESIEVWNSYQNSGVVPITSSNLKRRFRTWNLNVPRQENTRNRFVSNYLYSKFIFSSNKYFSFSDIISGYLPVSI